MPLITLTIIILFKITQISPQPSPYSFKLQFIGNTRYVSAEEEAQRDFCSNFWCINDAEILFTRSSQYNMSDPCDDFRNFSIGTALDINAVNDRYVYRGFISEIEFKFWEQLRRTLAAKIQPDEHRVVKVAKNVFQKCTKSRHVLRHLSGHMEIIARLQRLGGSPYLAKHVAWNPNMFDLRSGYGLLEQKNSSALDDENLWNADGFNLERIFELEAVDGLWLLLGYELERCKRQSVEGLCLRRQSPSRWNEVVTENIIEVLEYMNDNFIAGKMGKIELKTKMFRPAMDNFGKFAESLRKIEESEIGESEEKAITVEELAMTTEMDWIGMINDQLSDGLKVDVNQTVFVENFQFLEKMVKNLRGFDKRITADYFNLSYIFLYQFIFIFHFDENFVRNTIGTKKSPQRWESCLLFTLISFLQPAMIFIYNEKYRNEELLAKVRNFVEEAVDEAKIRFIEGNRLPLEASADVLAKLRDLKILISLEDFSESKVTEYYEDLRLNGSESFLDTFLAVKKFNLMIRNELEGSWRRRLEDLVQLQRITYDIEKGNILYIPSMWTLYPWMHPERPRFFNMATMFVQVLVRIQHGIKEYIEKYNLNSTSTVTGLENASQIAYTHYTAWLRSNSDLQIGANFLTNPQLFWMARAVFHFTKYHRTIPSEMNAIQRLQIEFMHVEFKSKAGFQEAFECAMNEDEKRIYEEYVRRYRDIVGIL